jgi:hypothetical protein
MATNRRVRRVLRRKEALYRCEPRRACQPADAADELGSTFERGRRFRQRGADRAIDFLRFLPASPRGRLSKHSSGWSMRISCMRAGCSCSPVRNRKPWPWRRRPPSPIRSGRAPRRAEPSKARFPAPPPPPASARLRPPPIGFEQQTQSRGQPVLRRRRARVYRRPQVR